MGHKFFLTVLLACAWSWPAHALRFSVNVTAPLVYIQVGHGELSSYGLLGGPASQVDEVVFNFPPGTQTGDGTPVTGTPVIPFAFLGYSGRNQANYRINIDSSAGLTNVRGDRLPFSEFSWTTQDGDIPAGQFNDSANQLLLDYRGRGRRMRGVVDYLTFSYNNTQIYPAGTYTGRVIYTITEL